MLEKYSVPVVFQNHYRASKKKLFILNNCRSVKKKRKVIKELISLCLKTIGYAKDSQYTIDQHIVCSSRDCADIARFPILKSELQRIIPLAEQIVNVAHRRIIQGEKVPAEEKIFSLFEEHTDIISKGSRDVVFGHKATITTGQSGLIVDVIIHDGNPADSTIVPDVLKNHKAFYKCAPKEMSFDGCYESNENRALLDGETNLEAFTFSKESDANLRCSTAKRKALRYFRAGIEATVSMLKRCFGWERVRNKGKQAFHKALKVGAIVYNLHRLVRLSTA
jgi:IS5 family transposase